MKQDLDHFRAWGARGCMRVHGLKYSSLLYFSFETSFVPFQSLGYKGVHEGAWSRTSTVSDTILEPRVEGGTRGCMVKITILVI